MNVIWLPYKRVNYSQLFFLIIPSSVSISRTLLETTFTHVCIYVDRYKCICVCIGFRLYYFCLLNPCYVIGAEKNIWDVNLQHSVAIVLCFYMIQVISYQGYQVWTSYFLQYTVQVYYYQKSSITLPSHFGLCFYRNDQDERKERLKQRNVIVFMFYHQEYCFS